MTVWLIVFLLANGEQAKPASEWQASKYQCERLRNTLESEANANGWTTRCLAWEIPEDFSLVRSDESEVSGSVAANCENSLVLRRLQELAHKIDGLAVSADQSVSSAKSTENLLRDVDRSVKRAESTVRSLRCYR